MLRFSGPATSFEVESDPQLNLLGHAQLEEWTLGSRCGGHGECGGDRVRIDAPSDALSPITPAERQHLSTDELKQGWRLACQCWPERADLAAAVHCPKLLRG